MPIEDGRQKPEARSQKSDRGRRVGIENGYSLWRLRVNHAGADTFIRGHKKTSALGGAGLKEDRTAYLAARLLRRSASWPAEPSS